MGFPVAHSGADNGGRFWFCAGKRAAGWIGRREIQAHAMIAENGILILVPSALFLASKACAAEFDTVFYAVQALELAAGAANIALIALNVRDGLAVSMWRDPRTGPYRSSHAGF